MVGQLVVIAGPDEGRAFTLQDGQTLVVGRGQSSDTRFKDPRVSRIHCQIMVDGGKVFLTDSGSASGTIVNGKSISQRELKPGDVVQIGATELRLQLEGGAESSTLYEGKPSRSKAAPALEPLEELSGKVLAHYEVGPLLAKGHTGVVFRANDIKENRTVALKVLGPEFTSNDEEMKRFVRAMKTMLPLRHPNLVRLYGAGKSGPCCWMAMEYIEGESLTQVIHRIGISGMLDWRNALRVAVHIARALEFAHARKIVHRNITPNNILIRTSDKVAKLGDLMLAKALRGALAQQVTRPGQLVGHIPYMSPESTRGPKEVDARSDIYSLGATIYALLTGRPPVEGESLPDQIKSIRQHEPAKPKKYQLSIPDLFEGTVMRMLAKRPEDRFQSATELLADLERVAKFQGMTV